MSTLSIPDDGTLADLVTYLSRAQRVDEGGAVRLVASGDALAAYVSPVHGGGGPTVLGLRVLRLARGPATDDVAGDGPGLDVTVSLAAMADRFARRPASGSGDVVELMVPAAPAVGVSWAGVSPPRTGWRPVGTLGAQVLLDATRRGVEEVAAGAGQGAGALAVARLRALVWGRDLPGAEGAPAGAAYAGEALGFVRADEPVALHACGAWRRLSTSRGHVLARPALI